MDMPGLRRQGVTATLQGNPDPAVLPNGPEVTTRETEALLRSMPARCDLVNLGQVLMPEPPIESVQAMLDAVHSESAELTSAAASEPGATS